MIDTYDDKIEKVMKPCIDAIWKACGEGGSLNYDSDGNYISQCFYQSFFSQSPILEFQ